MSVDFDYERNNAMGIEYLHACGRYGKCQAALGLIGNQSVVAWNHDIDEYIFEDIEDKIINKSYRYIDL